MILAFLSTYGLILLAAVLAGGSAGAVGFYTVGMRMPFLAVCTAHAALAGAILGQLAGVPVAAGGFIGALSAGLLLLWMLRTRDEEPGGAMGTLFSLALGVAFLGMGLQPGPKTAALSLMWGNLLFVSRVQVAMLAGATVLFAVFMAVWYAELKVILFSRRLAAMRVAETRILALFLAAASLVIAVNLQTVGGLLLYGLICNPAMAALKLARSYRAALGLSATFGVASALGGFFIAYWADLPVGACIVVVSCAMVGVAAALERILCHDVSG